MNLNDILVYNQVDPTSQLAQHLRAREDNMADQLRMAGAQFGLFGEIVAEVVAQLGLGTPPSPEERQVIRHNFTSLMERLAEEQGNG